MSAWLCSEEHIYEMAHYYVTHVAVTTMSAEQIAKLLYKENVASLVARYGDDEEDMPMKLLPQYQPIVTDPMHIAKLIGCYEYQSCETDTWEDSIAYDICQRMLAELNLPKEYWTRSEYDRAPWGFERDEYENAYLTKISEKICVL